MTAREVDNDSGLFSLLSIGFDPLQDIFVLLEHNPIDDKNIHIVIQGPGKLNFKWEPNKNSFEIILIHPSLILIRKPIYIFLQANNLQDLVVECFVVRWAKENILLDCFIFH